MLQASLRFRNKQPSLSRPISVPPISGSGAREERDVGRKRRHAGTPKVHWRVSWAREARQECAGAFGREGTEIHAMCSKRTQTPSGQRTSTERERVIVSQNPKTFFSVIADSVRAICQMTTPLGGADPKEGIVSARCGGWQPNRCDFKGP